MKTIVAVNLALISAAVCVAGPKLEATEGRNVTLLFKTGLERVDEVKIIFEGERTGKRLCAQYCSPDAAYICDPVETSHLQVEEGDVSFILVKVNISSAGLYTARAINTDNVVCEVTATLVVNKAPVSSTSPPHSSSSPTPPRSSDLHWLYALITAVVVIIIIIIIIIIILVFCCYCRRRKILCFRRENELENSLSDCVGVSFNGCGEKTEALLRNTRVPRH